jgi:hypothetical protein
MSAADKLRKLAEKVILGPDDTADLEREIREAQEKGGK